MGRGGNILYDQQPVTRYSGFDASALLKQVKSNYLDPQEWYSDVNQILSLTDVTQLTEKHRRLLMSVIHNYLIIFLQEIEDKIVDGKILDFMSRNHRLGSISIQFYNALQYLLEKGKFGQQVLNNLDYLYEHSDVPEVLQETYSIGGTNSKLIHCIRADKKKTLCNAEVNSATWRSTHALRRQYIFLYKELCSRCQKAADAGKGYRARISKQDFAKLLITSSTYDLYHYGERKNSDKREFKDFLEERLTASLAERNTSSLPPILSSDYQELQPDVKEVDLLINLTETPEESNG